jgi:regulation of enolase protein 1 (concanavalin A-like superfamily)
MNQIAQTQRRARSLLSAALALAFTFTWPTHAGSILRELFEGISGVTVADLTNSPAYPNSPTSTSELTTAFEAPIDVLDNYGQRVHGYVIAPTTGNYTFWISSDDASTLYLSTDENPVNVRQIAYVSSWTASREWTKEANQQSAPVALVANQKYYISALMKEGGGGDNLAVRWQLPGGTMEEPIPASRLLPYGTAFTPPVITQQPQSQTIVEGQPVTFSVAVSNLDPVNYQWQRNGANIAGATLSTYSIAAVAMTDNSAKFRCVLSNALGTTTSSEATLTVTPDTTKPTLVKAQNVGTTSVTVTFSEPVASPSATTASNYSLSGGVSVSAAAFGADTKSITLTTSALTIGTPYTLTVNNVKDRAATPNTILANSQLSFTAVDYAPADIGNPAQPGSSSPAGNGLHVVAGGTDIGGVSDQFHFDYQTRTGNFDLQVRVQSLGNTDLLAEAGLMARETLDANSRFAATLATPSLNGCSFVYRSTTAGAATSAGSFPANYPNTWLRLKRSANTFTSYASYDGQTWRQLGSVSIAMPTTIYFGFAAASHSANQTTTVEFRDLATVVGGTVGALAAPFEPLGPSSRKTGLILSEIMYHPAARADGKELEFVEIMNTQPWPEDISGFRLSGAVEFTFAPGTILGAGAILVVAKAPADLTSVHGISNAAGPYTGALQNGSGTVRLRNRLDAVLLEANYSGNAPFPASADGAGHSLVLARPSYGEADPRAWAPSDVVGGSPGEIEAFRPSPLRSVVINEFLAHTDDPELDFIELYNHSNQAVDLSGCYLSDDPSTNKFKIPSGTSIPARGFVAFDQNQLGFALSASGETICFVNPDQTRVLDSVRFGGQENGVSRGRSPDGAPTFHRLASKTKGAANSGLKPSPVVINEIMYNPLSGDDDDEFVELFNRSGATVDLSGWRLRDGIDFDLPASTTLAANSYLVIARNAARLLTNYPGLTSANTLGNFSGRLSNQGERITLQMPDEIISTNQNGTLKTNLIHIVMNEVTYGDGGRWGKWADGGGSSLELTDPDSDNRLAPNWADSDETGKASWTNVEFTGRCDNGNGTMDSFQLFLLGAGECLVDNVEAIGPGGNNRVSNSTFESGTTGWAFQGTHDASSQETTQGYSSSRSLHVRATGRGDTGANRIRTALSTAFANGDTVTLRAKVKWLMGYPEILLRLKGNYLEAVGQLALPTNLGTPGAANSRLLANAGPAIWEVSHSPVLPAASQAVVVTARLHDPDGLGTRVVNYRVDPSATYTTVNLKDDGTGGDAIAGDGVYAATIPGQAAGALVAFYLEATDSGSPAATTRFPSDAPTRECLVYFGTTQPSGNFPFYNLWITQATANRWSTREKNSNKPLDGTFAYNNTRVVYNIGTLYSGSPWHTPGYNGPLGNSCDYVAQLPSDDAVLGATDFVLATVGNLGNDNTAQREQLAFWMLSELGAPANYRRYVHVYLNGQKRSFIYEDSQQPNSDMIDEFFADDDNGELFKIEDWFEFDDSGDGKLFNVDATLQNFTTTGGAKKTARYRWCWRKRALNNSASDYTSLFALVDAVNAADATVYTAQTEALADMDEWMRVFCVEHLVGNWDAYGYNRGKNMYGYKGRDGRWHLMAWDIDFVLGSGSDGPTSSMFGSNDPTVTRMYNHPPFRRAYFRAMYEAVNGPLQDAKVAAITDPKYAALLANGIAVASPASTKTWIQSRRSYLQSQLDGVAANFEITSNGGANYSSSQNLITLTGNAPVQVKTIKINGVEFPMTWTGVTSWSTRVALGPGANALTLTAYDSAGNPITGLSDTITITYTGTPQLPQDYLVLNEIMYNAAVPDAGFVELFNKSSTTAFDLSNFRLDGTDFAFPGGTIIAPGAFAVVANDAAAFAAAYGSSIPLVGTYDGSLQNNGETLKLVKPGVTPEQDQIIDEVTYDSAPPWPTIPNGFGPSLQLIDPAQDNNRVANWGATAGGGGGGTENLIAMADSWKYSQAGTDLGTSWRQTSYNDAAWPSGGALLYVENAALPAPKTTALTIGPRTFYFRTKFNFTGNPATTTLTVSTVIDDGAVVYLNGVEVLRLGMAAGAIDYNTFASRTVGDAAYEGPFTISSASLVQGENVLAVEVHQVNAGSSDVVFGLTLDAQSNAGSPYTPGATNSVLASLTPLPLLWLNEVQPNNLTGSKDRMGDRDPWVELYNSGAAAISLSGYYLSDDYAAVAKWAFPAATINPGQFLVVWLDGEPGESNASELHANFRAASPSGSVVLTKVAGAETTVIDYLNYTLINADRSYGAFPDGTPTKRQKFYYATPGAANNNGYPPLLVTINEWMASNGSVADPADGDFDDWFELHNAGASVVDLSGYTLTDTLATPAMWTIPEGTTIPAGGYLLVWADSEPGQNGPGALHANFKLSGSGEAIGLYAPNATLVDSVTFGAQVSDVSEGRWPDGNAPPFVAMTTPTPGSANTTGDDENAAPVLSAIGNKTVNEGSLLTFTTSATDPDSAQTLTFSLDAGAPAGAVINPTSGVFTWTPTEAQGPGSYPVTVRVTDDGSPALSDSETITIMVNEVNSAPTLAPVGDKVTPEGALLSFVVAGSDADEPAQTLTYSLEAAPPGASIHPATGVFSWTPSEAQGPGVYSATIVVADNGTPSLNAAETISITVGEVNSPPVLAAIGNKSVNEGATVAFTATAGDLDLPAQALTFSLDAGAPAGASIHPTTGAFTWTPTEADGPGTFGVTVRVTDAAGASDFEIVSVTVNEVNTAPVLAAIGNKTVDEGQALTVTATATDSDAPAQTLTFSLDAGAPAGASIDAGTGAFAWTPTEAQGPGTHSVTVRVTDNGSPAQSDSETITITVNEVNAAPVLASLGTKTVNEGDALSFTATATDSDSPAQTLTFSLDAGAPAGASIHPSTGAFTWTPSEADGGSTKSVTIRVTDGGSPALNDSETITITVNEVNATPVLAAIGGQSVNEGETLSFTATAMDSDSPAQTLTFSLDAGAPAGTSINPSTGAFTWTPTEAQGPGSYSVSIRATDNGSPIQSDSKSVTITVNEVNVAPLLAAIGNQAVNEGETLSFTATATDSDSPAQTLTFSLDAGAPAGATIDPGTGTFTWTPTEADGGSTKPVTIRVTDNGSPAQSDSETITITVNEVNAAPILAAIAEQSVNEGETLTFTITATDSDAPAQALTFSLDAGAPTGTYINSTSGVFRWTPTEAQGPGAHQITVRVTDDGAGKLSDTKTFSLVVNEVNTAPTLEAIAYQSVTVGSTVTFTAKATDADQPAQPLTFALDPGAPADASLDPATGVFTWAVPASQTEGTVTLTLRVTDDAASPLSATTTTKITVTAASQPLRITGVSSVADGKVLTWQAQSGKRYQVQYNDALGAAGWTDLGSPITADSATATVQDPQRDRPHRFYRVVLQP